MSRHTALDSARKGAASRSINRGLKMFTFGWYQLLNLIRVDWLPMWRDLPRILVPTIFIRLS